MVLSNIEIIGCFKEELFSIDPFPGDDPTKSPYNTSAIDLRLGNEIRVPNANAPVQLDLSKSGIAKFLAANSSLIQITKEQPFSLRPNKFILAGTLEKVNFPLNTSGINYSARVEGKSSLSRCGILIHFTAPTIHAGFYGPIALEVINLGTYDFLLIPEMFICQLIIEEVKGNPIKSPSQFRGQTNPTGVVA